MEPTNGRFPGSLQLKDILTWLALAFICSAAILLRCATINESLWLDELHTSWCVSDSLDDVGPRARIGNNSPLYFYLVWAVVQVAGEREWTLRLLSLMGGAALVPTVFFLLKHWTGRASAALVGAALVAVESNNLFFSAEARPYALLQWIAAIHVYLFWLAQQTGHKSIRLAWIAIGTLLYYLHYTTALLVIAQVVAYVILKLLRLGGMWTWKSFMIDTALLGVVCSLSYSHLVDIASRRENWRLFVQQQPFRSVFSIFPLGSTVVLPALAVASTFLIWRTGRQARRPSQLLCVAVIATCWLTIPILLAWMSTDSDLARLFFRRYVMASGAAVAIIAGILVSLCARDWLRYLIALTVTVVAAFQIGPFDPRLGIAIPPHSPQDWRAAIEAISRESRDQNPPIFVRSGLIEADALRQSEDGLLREFCLLPVLGLYRLEREAHLEPLPTTDSEKLTERQLGIIIEHQSAWFLLAGWKADADRMRREVTAALSRRGVKAHIQFVEAGRGQVWVLRLNLAERP